MQQINIIIFSLILFVSVQGNPQEDIQGIEYNMVRLLDTVERNFLFRTVKPVSKHQFLFEDLVAQMKLRAINEGFVWNDDLKVHLYSFFLNDSQIRDEHTPLSWEKEYFQQHPENGKLIHFELGGSIFYANNLPPFIRKDLAITYPEWSWDRMNELIPLIHTDLQKQESYQKVIVFHCWTGLDRTGEVYGSYLMNIRNWSYRKTLDFNNALIDGFPTRTWSRNGLNWYCWYLFYTTGQGQDCDYEPAIITNNTYAYQP